MKPWNRSPPGGTNRAAWCRAGARPLEGARHRPDCWSVAPLADSRTNTSHNALIFALLERKDQPDPKHPDKFIAINASNNVYKASGSYLRDPVYQWTRETNSGALGLSTHVPYIHSKFMLIDPLGEDPIVVTGSANFSLASTTDNDESMIAIRGNYR